MPISLPRTKRSTFGPDCLWLVGRCPLRGLSESRAGSRRTLERACSGNYLINSSAVVLNRPGSSVMFSAADAYHDRPRRAGPPASQSPNRALGGLVPAPRAWSRSRCSTSAAKPTWLTWIEPGAPAPPEGALAQRPLSIFTRNAIALVIGAIDRASYSGVYCLGSTLRSRSALAER